MTFRSHYNIATEGVRAGHKLLAKLGFGFTVEIIVNRITGGGGFFAPPEKRRLILNPLYSLIQIQFNGKEENFWFYTISRTFGIEMTVRLIKTEKSIPNRPIIETFLNRVMRIKTDPVITVKDIKNDSAK